MLTLNAKGAQSRGEGAFIEDMPFLLGPWLGIFFKSGAGWEVLAPSLLKQPFKKLLRYTTWGAKGMHHTCNSLINFLR